MEALITLITLAKFQFPPVRLKQGRAAPAAETLLNFNSPRSD